MINDHCLDECITSKPLCHIKMRDKCTQRTPKIVFLVLLTIILILLVCKIKSYLSWPGFVMSY